MNKVNAFWTGVIVASVFWTVGVYAGKAIAYKVWDDIKALFASWKAKGDAALAKQVAKI